MLIKKQIINIALVTVKLSVLDHIAVGTIFIKL